MIEIRDLTKSFGDKVAVNHLSFTVAPGIVTGFLGPNGSGKSTTMKMILGLTTPSSGTATVKGKNYRELHAPLREVGALLDAKALHPGRTARNHLLALALSNGIAPSRVEEVLDIVGLSDVANQRAGKFSLGMSQRLGIAAALLGDPGVLMFDEPINGLDPEGIRWVRELFQQLADEGRTVLVSSHLMSEMALTAEKFIIIGKGELIREGTKAELLANGAKSVHVRTPKRPEFIALAQANTWEFREEGEAFVVEHVDAATIGDVAFAGGIPLHELAPTEISLEDAFMKLTAESVEYSGKRRSRRGANS